MTTRIFSSLAKAILCCTVIAAFTACSSEDDQYNLNALYEQYRVIPDTFAIAIAWNGTTATVTGETDSVTVTYGTNPADVTITSVSNRYMELTLSGATDDGSLLVYSQKAWGLILNDVSITNADGPAINNQSSKWLYVKLNGSSTLADGLTYASAPFNAQGDSIDQKGTFFSEGEMDFSGTGSLSVSANGRNGIACDDYIVVNEGTISVKVASTGSNGIKVNDGMQILDGLIDISVASLGGRGIKNDARMTINGGQTTIKTSGNCRIETVDGIRDTTTAAGIKCDSLFTMTAGQLTITSTGDGGKGINCADSVKFSGGQLSITTTGNNKQGKPKGVKSEKAVILSGGSFESKVSKSKACDNNGDDTPEIIGTPVKTVLETRHVLVKFSDE